MRSQTQGILVLDLILLLEEMGLPAINVTLFFFPRSSPAHFICTCISVTSGKTGALHLLLHLSNSQPQGLSISVDGNEILLLTILEMQEVLVVDLILLLLGQLGHQCHLVFDFLKSSAAHSSAPASQQLPGALDLSNFQPQVVSISVHVVFNVSWRSSILAIKPPQCQILFAVLDWRGLQNVS